MVRMPRSRLCCRSAGGEQHVKRTIPCRKLHTKQTGQRWSTAAPDLCKRSTTPTEPLITAFQLKRRLSEAGAMRYVVFALDTCLSQVQIRKLRDIVHPRRNFRQYSCRLCDAEIVMSDNCRESGHVLATMDCMTNVCMCWVSCHTV